MKKIMFGNSLMLLGIAIMILAGLELIYIRVIVWYGGVLFTPPAFSPASLFPEDLTPCRLFSLIMASHLMGWPRCGFRVVHRVEKLDAENTAKPRWNCSGEALLLTT